MAYRNALAARKKLVGMAANTPYFEYGLAKTQMSLGSVLSARRQYAEAEGLLAAAQAKLENLAAKNSEVTDYVGGLGVVCAARGDHEQRRNQYEPALQWYGKAIDTLVALRSKSPKAERPRGNLINALSGRAASLTRLNRLPEATKDWEQALILAKDDEKSELRLGQAITLAQQGDHAKATSSAEESIKDPKTSGKLFMKGAAVFALAGLGALRDVRLAAADQTALAERYATRAIELLERARELGYFKKAENRANLNEEPEWNELKNRDDFKKFWAEVGEQQQ
jgi:tetratricopeptide (TPR) repeat protein